MKFIRSALAAAILLLAAAGTALGHTASSSCESITLANSAKDATVYVHHTSTVALGPVAGNHTYSIAPGTYDVRWTDGYRVTNLKVKACPTPQPTSTPTSTPTAAPTPTPTPTVTSTPSASPVSTPAVTPSPDPTQPAPTTTPTAPAPTLPPTDTDGGSDPDETAMAGIGRVLLTIGAFWFVISIIEGRAAERRRNGR